MGMVSVHVVQQGKQRQRRERGTGPRWTRIPTTWTEGRARCRQRLRATCSGCCCARSLQPRFLGMPGCGGELAGRSRGKACAPRKSLESDMVLKAAICVHNLGAQRMRTHPRTLMACRVIYSVFYTNMSYGGLFLGDGCESALFAFTEAFLFKRAAASGAVPFCLRLGWQCARASMYGPIIWNLLARVRRTSRANSACDFRHTDFDGTLSTTRRRWVRTQAVCATAQKRCAQGLALRPHALRLKQKVPLVGHVVLVHTHTANQTNVCVCVCVWRQANGRLCTTSPADSDKLMLRARKQTSWPRPQYGKPSHSDNISFGIPPTTIQRSEIT